MHFTLPATFSFACIGVNLVFAGLSAGIGWRGGWREMRWFALVCLSAASFNACNVPITLEMDPGVLRLASSVSLVLAAVHGAAWLFYIAADAKRRLTRIEKGYLALVLAASGLATIPGIAVSDTVQTRHNAWLDVTYADVLPTSFGLMVYALCVGFLLFPLVHFVRQYRRGAPMAGAFALGLAALFVAGLNDALVGAGVLDLPYVLDIGFVALVVASGGAMVRRFVNAARELDLVKGKLEQLVAERTEQLARTQAALAQSEKLAAVGNLAAGVAHEINNPTAAVLANLAYLMEPMSQGQPLPDDAYQCIEESFTSTKRIGRIVRQLLDAGRVAGGKQGHIAPLALAGAVRSALANTRAQQHKVEVHVDIDEAVHVLGDQDLFAQVVVNVVVNAAQAIADARPSGHVRLHAEVRQDRVFLFVADDGPGIPPAVQHRLFEPFFTTKPQGRGTGLGLAVSLGLMRAQGGDLRLHTTSPEGTTLVVELPLAQASAALETVAPAAAGPRSTMRLLLVDDEPVVLEALRRSLGAWFQVQTTSSVDGALELLKDPGTFDLALCDIIMPDGGGERLLAELAERGSPFAERTLFRTAGAVTPAARAFVERHQSRVLQKPVEPGQLLALAESLTRAGTVARAAGRPPASAASVSSVSSVASAPSA
ncbi:MAG: hybrid sensor histidine kinase/response regulator [Deltaproteobacteria bacterium]|nr:hybrid sensor histidine kinase/response regulator [Deltaproteobacteria bacterium]